MVSYPKIYRRMQSYRRSIGIATVKNLGCGSLLFEGCGGADYVHSWPSPNMILWVFILNSTVILKSIAPSLYMH